ncbi:MAG: ABC transporter ATP-binding protein/permease [Lachnospiraceae bacterium]|nr:ABC transporter ATP-binding protein/permease [Lachnospiraceae bacterium]
MSKKKDENNMPLREAFAIYLRAIRLLGKNNPVTFPITLAVCAWDALTPYVGIYLSALILNELAGDRDREVLVRIILIALVSAAIIALVGALLRRFKQIRCDSTRWYEQNFILGDKSFSTDFANIEEQENRDLYSTIMQNQNGGGWGLERVYDTVENLLRALFGLFGGIALTVSLFTTPVPADGGAYTMLNRPWFLVFFLAVLLLFSGISMKLSGVAYQMFAAHAGDHNLGNRLFGFFGFLGVNKTDAAADIRMYHTEKISSKYMNDKTSIFGSQGYFAKLSWTKVGPLNAAAGAVRMSMTGIIYLYVCLKALGGAFGIGSVTQYVASVASVFGSISKLMELFVAIRTEAAFLKLDFEFLDLPDKMYQGSLTVEKRMDRDYEIEFKDVSFRYPGSEVWALRHVNMKFRIGERLAVVGQNGSGKTTFIKLLTRLYDPTEGEILLNGINIKKYNYREYMAIFSVVFQDFTLFPFKLGQNVGCGVNYDRERAKQCLVDAGFGDRLEELAQAASGGGQTDNFNNSHSGHDDSRAGRHKDDFGNGRGKRRGDSHGDGSGDDRATDHVDGHADGAGIGHADGLDTYLYKNISPDGIDISGGEAQKIAIARTIMKDAPFIVLDEPTAALDPLAEARVYENFNSIISDKTAVYISHRLSSCRFCDEIAVFDEGRVVQKGSHEELVKDESGKYYELWTAQAQYYQSA